MNPRNTARGLISAACAFALAWLSNPCAAQANDSQPGASAKRRFTVDDLFRLESLVENYGGPFAFSPDGRKLAVARLRPQATWTDYKLDFLGTAGADVWVQVDAGRALTNITNGIEDGSGWWAPQWSPDGERLAMLSTRGGNVCLWVWEAKTGELARATTRGIALNRAQPYLWIDSERLLYPALPPGQKPLLMQVEIQTTEIATQMWPRARRGEEVTASVLHSGIAVHDPRGGKEELLVVSWDGRASKSLATGRTRGWQLSADGKALAFARAGESLLQPGKPEPIVVWGLDIALFRGDAVEVHPTVARDVVIGTIRWSPRSASLALLARETGRNSLAVVRVARDGTQLSRAPLHGIPETASPFGSHQLAWAGDQQLLVRAPAREEAASARSDWWLQSPSSPLKCLTCAMNSAPSTLVSMPGSAHSFAGIAAGELWSLDASGARLLTDSFEPVIQDLVQTSPVSTRAPLVFTAVRADGKRAAYAWQAGEPYELASAPEAPAMGAVVSANGKSLLWTTNDHTGLRVWRTSRDGRDPQRIVDANRFLQNIDEGAFQQIDYTSQEGQPLQGWLILPPGRQGAGRYPLLVSVYPEFIVPEQPAGHWRISSGGALNPQIPVARGYAVLIPSMPLRPQGEADDPMLKLQHGVMPAIDKAVELGIADEGRLFLMGHSFGGYATCGLVTQTHRFKAAIAVAAPTNLLSHYGQWDARFRYLDHAPQKTHQHQFESGQFRMGDPPWEAFDRYRRNSPIFSVERVETPLMLVHGDLDYVPLEQSEEFFLSLRRRGARAQFVRYWGEGHMLRSPANIRDFWARAFSWFESFSPAGADRSSAAP